MIALSLGEIAHIVGGEVSEADASVLVAGPASVDSRAMSPAGLFVALAGEHLDGHQFAASAAEHGAVAVLGTRATCLPTVIVADAQHALGKLATYVVGSLPDLTTFAITGSQGKTGTKDYLAAIMADVGVTVATAGNYNNEIGVPLTLLRATNRTQSLVVEMGARGEGDITYLCSLARPTLAAVLNVGTAHLGEFGSRAGIARAKGELVEALPPSGTAVLNSEDDLTMAMAARTSARVITFGAHGDVAPHHLVSDDFGRLSFDLAYHGASAPVRLHGLGAHQVDNACAAAALALAAGVELTRVATALSAARLPSRWRMEFTERADGLAVINDSYNANPASMAAAIETLAEIGRRSGRRTIAVLGEMRELGVEAPGLHREIGRLVARQKIDQLVTIGEEAAAILAGARELPEWGGLGLAVAGRDQAIEWVGHNVAASDVVLIKASRGAALEHIATALLGEAGVSHRQQERDQQ